MKIQERKHEIQLIVLSFLSIHKEENIKPKVKRKRWCDIESLFALVHEIEEANKHGTRFGIWAIFHFDDICCFTLQVQLFLCDLVLLQVFQ